MPFLDYGGIIADDDRTEKALLAETIKLAQELGFNSYSFFDKYEVKVKFVGDLSKLPPKLVKLMGKIMQKTAKYQKKVHVELKY